jgi:hypothetical protein
MLTAAAMAVNIHQGLDESYPGFVLAYALGHIALARPLTNRYAVGFAIATSLGLISAFIKYGRQFH